MAGVSQGRNPEGCVVVGDGDVAARRCVADLLRSVGFDTREAENGLDALQLVRSTWPALVLLDVALPEISGYQLCHMLRHEYGPGMPILLYSSDRLAPHDKAAGLLLGADGYLAKPLASAELLAWVYAHTVYSVQSQNNRATETLTASELRVLRLLASGMHTKAIAHQLAISPKTVSMHIHNTMKKFDIHTRTQAVALAHQLGLVDGGGTNGSGNQVYEVSVTPSGARI